MPEYIFIDKKFIPPDKALIPVNDRGFMYGDGVFETMRSSNGRVFLLEEHIRRLIHSCRLLKYNLPYNENMLGDFIKETIEKNKLGQADAYIKLIISRGDLGKSLFYSGSEKPRIIIIAKVLDPYPEKYYIEGVNIVSSSITRSSEGNLLYQHKLLNYFENIYAKSEANSSGALEAIFLTRDKLVLEGATSNIFIVKRNNVETTPLTQNILPGTVRQFVIEKCNEHWLRVREKKIHYFDLINADEVFLTNSIMGILPVRKIDRFELDNPIPGKLTEKIMQLYKNTIYK